MTTHDTPEKSYDLERMIFFTDGVFAIAITLLVIELRLPEDWDRSFIGLWREEWRSFLAYAVSFMVVAVFWNAHRMLFRLIVRFHNALVFGNFLLLGFVVLVPFAATLIFRSGPQGEPFLIYLGLMAAIALSQATLWGLAIACHVVDPRLEGRTQIVILGTMIVIPVMLAAAGLSIGAVAVPYTFLIIAPAIVFSRWRRRLMQRDLSPVAVAEDGGRYWPCCPAREVKVCGVRI